MDNLIVKKVWEDESVIEIEITAISEYVTAHQKCYVNDRDIRNICCKIKEYCSNYTKDVYIQVGKKTGNYTPAFSMNVLRADSQGHVKIEMDIEIDDIENRSHRCVFFINSELGAIERFGMQLFGVCQKQLGECVKLF